MRPLITRHIAIVIGQGGGELTQAEYLPYDRSTEDADVVVEIEDDEPVAEIPVQEPVVPVQAPVAQVPAESLENAPKTAA